MARGITIVDLMLAYDLYNHMITFSLVAAHPDGDSEVNFAVANSEIPESLTISPLAPPESIRVHESDNSISCRKAKVAVRRLGLQLMESVSIN
jgi:hypothetical protein